MKIFAVAPRLNRGGKKRSLKFGTFFPLYDTEQTSVYGTERQRRGAIKKYNVLKVINVKKKFVKARNVSSNAHILMFLKSFIG